MRINEVDKPLTQSDIEQLERFADKIFAKVGIDVEFTRHFLDRVNDERNIRQITMSELTRLFKQQFKKYGKSIAKLGPDTEAVMKDLATDVNMPFALVWDKNNEELDLIAKTVMRKNDFKTSNPEFTVESEYFRAMSNGGLLNFFKKYRSKHELPPVDKILFNKVKQEILRRNLIRNIDEDQLFEDKNTHLEHLEDEIINQGKDGVKRVINYLGGLYTMLQGHSDSKMNVTVKWDGAPAIICGIDPEDGKFFVGTKGVFAGTPKLNKTLADIEKNHPDVTKKGELESKEGLREKLRLALQVLPELNIQGVVQGDFLFAKDTLKTTEIDGKAYLIFKPNTITYAVPADSDLAKEMQSARMGIIFHTRYTGDTISTMKAGFNVDASEFTNTSNVWFDDATYKDVTGAATMTAQESARLAQAISDMQKYLSQLDSKTFDILSNSPIKDVGVQLKAHVNQYIRSGSITDNPAKFVTDFTQRLRDRTEIDIEKLKTGREGPAGQRKLLILQQSIEWVENNRRQLEAIYGLYLRVKAAKQLIINKLNTIQGIEGFLQQSDGSFKATNPEGFVAVDHMGGAVKLVDRLEFSAANFADKDFG
jgi:hypothetical protein